MSDSAESDIKKRLKRLEESVKKSAESNQALLEYVKSNQDQLTLIRDALDRRGGGGTEGRQAKLRPGKRTFYF